MSTNDSKQVAREMRKVVRGTVVSDKMQKTVVVQVDRKVRHPIYEKFVSRRTRLPQPPGWKPSNFVSVPTLGRCRARCRAWLRGGSCRASVWPFR